jgi:hypothetical protein
MPDKPNNLLTGYFVIISKEGIVGTALPLKSRYTSNLLLLSKNFDLNFFSL